MPELPPVECGAYLVKYLFEVGPTLATPMGSSPLSYGELESWCNRLGLDLLPWESRFICRLSREYLGETVRAQKRGCPAPWQQDGAKPQPTAAQLAIRAIAEK